LQKKKKTTKKALNEKSILVIANKVIQELFWHLRKAAYFKWNKLKKWILLKFRN